MYEVRVPCTRLPCDCGHLAPKSKSCFVGNGQCSRRRRRRTLDGGTRGRKSSFEVGVGVQSLSFSGVGPHPHHAASLEPTCDISMSCRSRIMRARHRKTCLALFAGRAPNDKCDHTEEREGRGGGECSSSEVVGEVAAWHMPHASGRPQMWWR